jgi:CheY-like chemotaxis protein
MAPLQQTVLVVEDERVTRLILARHLEQAGFRVVPVEDGETALTLLRDPAFVVDWLYTDIKLPGLVDGWIVGAEFHLGHPLRPVVYATAQARRSEAETVRSLFVRKPFDPALIVAFFRDAAAREAAPTAIRPPAAR